MSSRGAPARRGTPGTAYNPPLFVLNPIGGIGHALCNRALFWRFPLTELPPHQLWSAALGHLQIEIPRPNYETFLKGTTGVRYQGETLIVGTRSTFAAEMLTRRLSSTVSRAVEWVAKRPIDVSFEVISGNGGTVPGTRATNEGAASRPAFSSPATDGLWVRLHPHFSFKNFVVGPSNELAHAAATEVAKNPANAYNPLYLWSKVGLGKTHLLQAISHELIASGLNVIYVSSERFTNEYIKAIREKTTEKFREHYRNADALLIDDIQFIAGKEQTQEGFFHTFNELQLRGHQVVVSGDEPACKSLLEERIQSRLEGGLVVDIQPPEYETRVAILRKKADALGVTLSLDVLDLLAKRNFCNVRELEGCLNRVVAYAHLTRAPLTVDTVNRVLADILSTDNQRPANPDVILKVVAKHFGIDASAICGRRRDKHTSLARHVVMYLLREESGLSSTRIGTFLGGKDHSTVLYAQKRVTAQLKDEPLLRQDLTRIRRAITDREFS